MKAKQYNLNGNFNTFYLMRLVSRSYFKNYGAIFTDFVLPVIIMSILFNVLEKDSIQLMVPGIILSPIASSSFISFSVGLVEWKGSVLMKKIKVSRISTTQFFMAFIFFYFLISLLAFGVGFSYTLLLEQMGLKNLEGVLKQTKNVSWGYAMIGLFQLILIATSSGFLISIFVKRVNGAIAFGLTLFLVQAFLLGYYLPINMIVKNEGMQIASYVTPFFAPTRIFQAAWLQKFEFEKFNMNGIAENIEYIENWQIWVYDSDAKKWLLKNINFYKSYWNLILLSFGWILATSSLSIWLNNYRKEN